MNRNVLKSVNTETTSSASHATFPTLPLEWDEHPRWQPLILFVALQINADCGAFHVFFYEWLFKQL